MSGTTPRPYGSYAYSLGPYQGPLDFVSGYYTLTQAAAETWANVTVSFTLTQAATETWTNPATPLAVVLTQAATETWTHPVDPLAVILTQAATETWTRLLRPADFVLTAAMVEEWASVAYIISPTFAHMLAATRMSAVGGAMWPDIPVDPCEGLWPKIPVVPCDGLWPSLSPAPCEGWEPVGVRCDCGNSSMGAMFPGLSRR